MLCGQVPKWTTGTDCEEAKCAVRGLELDNKQKGNLAIASAIKHFVSAGYTVSIPLSDTAKYDLVVGGRSGNNTSSQTLAMSAALQRNL